MFKSCVFFKDLIKLNNLFKYFWHLFILIWFLLANFFVDDLCVVEFFDLMILDVPSHNQAATSTLPNISSAEGLLQTARLF